MRETVPGLRIETLAYPDHAATEWQLRLQAPEAGESPLYENLKSADFEVAFPANAAGDAALEQRQPLRAG